MRFKTLVLGTLMAAGSYVGVKHLNENCSYTISYKEYPNKTFSNYVRPDYVVAVCSCEGTSDDYISGLKAGEKSAKDSIIKSKNNPETLPLIKKNMIHIQDSIKKINVATLQGFEQGKEFVTNFANNGYNWVITCMDEPKAAYYWDMITNPKSVVKRIK